MKSQSYNTINSKKENDISICIKCCLSAPCITETLENEFDEGGKKFAVQKSISEPIKLECKESQNYNGEAKNIILKSNPALNDAKCEKQKKKYDKKTDIDIETSPSQLVKDPNQSELQRVFGTNEKENDIAVETDSAPLVPKCKKIKNNSVKITYKNVSKEQIESKKNVKSLSYNEEEQKNAVQITPAPSDLACLKGQIKYERKNETSAQTKYMQCKNISKEPYAKSQSHNDYNWKNTIWKTICMKFCPSAPCVTETLENEYAERENAIAVQKSTSAPIKLESEGERDIGVQTNPSSYVITEDQKQSELQFVECQDNNEKDKAIAVKTAAKKSISAPTILECVECQYYNEEEKDIGVQTNPAQYVPITKRKEQTKSEYAENRNEYVEEKDIGVQTHLSDCLIKTRQKQNELQCEEYQNKIEVNKEIATKTSSALTSSKCLKEQIKYPKIESKSYDENQNYNEEGKKIAVRNWSDTKDLKRQNESEKETSSQTKCTQHRNISKERIKSKLLSQNYNEEEKETAAVTKPAPTDQECLKKKIRYEKEKETAAQTKYVQYKSKENLIEPSATLIGSECLKCQNKNEEKKNIVQSKYIQYQNISKHTLDEQNVKSQNSNSREKKIDIQPCSKLTDLECTKRQIKNAEKKNTSVQGKYIQYKNIDNVKSETINPKCCNLAPCVTETLETESGVQESISAPIKQNCVEYQNEREKKINRQTNPAQYVPLTEEQKQSKLRFMKSQNNEQEKEITVKPKCSLPDSECLKKQIKYESEKDTSAQTRYTKYRDGSKEQIDCKPCNKCQNYEKEISKETFQSKNKTNKEVTSQRLNKSDEKKRKTLCFDNIHYEINERNKNCNFSKYVTSKDYSKPKNFQHLFTRKNIGNNSQYITRENSISSTLQGCSRKCSGYMTTIDYNKPERFAHLFSTSNFDNSEDSKLIKSSDEYFKKDFISQSSQYNLKVARKDEKLVSDNYYLAIKKPKSNKERSKEVINTNNTSTIYHCAKKCIESRSILKNLIYTKINPQKTKASEKNSTTSTYDMLKNMFLKN